MIFKKKERYINGKAGKSSRFRGHEFKKIGGSGVGGVPMHRYTYHGVLGWEERKRISFGKMVGI